MKVARFGIALIIMAIVGLVSIGFAAYEHGGMEKKMPGKLLQGPKADNINKFVMTYIKEDVALKGAFLVFDPVDNKAKNLKFDKLLGVIATDSGDFIWCSDF